jgi:hypothetical protein
MRLRSKADENDRFDLPGETQIGSAGEQPIKG